MVSLEIGGVDLHHRDDGSDDADDISAELPDRGELDGIRSVGVAKGGRQIRKHRVQGDDRRRTAGRHGIVNTIGEMVHVRHDTQ